MTKALFYYLIFFCSVEITPSNSLIESHRSHHQQQQQRGGIYSQYFSSGSSGSREPKGAAFAWRPSSSHLLFPSHDNTPNANSNVVKSKTSLTKHFALPTARRGAQHATQKKQNKIRMNSTLSDNTTPNANSPFPTMPSAHFCTLAQCQFELLANSLQYDPSSSSKTQTQKSKIKSMSLYLPRENPMTGQLEFVPSVLYPNNERIFIANDAETGEAPYIPKTLTRLPGFAHAKSVLPSYPFAAVDATGHYGACGVGQVEEVMCDIAGSSSTTAFTNGDKNEGGGSVLSVPLYQGSQTVGVLLIWPSDPPEDYQERSSSSSCWTALDREQVSRAAYGLIMALSMDIQRVPSPPPASTGIGNTASTVTSGGGGNFGNNNTIGNSVSDIGTTVATTSATAAATTNVLFGGNYTSSILTTPPPPPSTKTYEDLLQAQQLQSEQLGKALAENLHQIKNPLQALRTFGKLLQRKLALEDFDTSPNQKNGVNLVPLRTLAENMMLQSDRVADLLEPMDDLVMALENRLYLPPASPSSSLAMVVKESTPPLYLVPGQQQQQKQTKEKSSTSPFSARNSNRNMGYNNVTNFGPSNTFQTIPNREETVSNNISPKQDAVWFGPSTTTTTDDSSISSPQSPPSQQQNLHPFAHQSNLGDFELEMAFVPDIIEPILSASCAVASERGISFQITTSNAEMQDLPGARICPKSLQEALANVLDNAIKYVLITPTNDYRNNPKIEVSLKPNAKPLDAGVTILVKDNGPGIPVKERDSIFSRGYRGCRTRDFIGGNGIGLDISRSMMARMGGLLDVVEDNEGGDRDRGTIMRFVLFRDPK